MVAYAMRGCLFILYCGLFAVPLKRISGYRAFFMEKNPSANIYLINLPIVELPLSETFKLRAKLMDFFTLQDIIALDQAMLFEREGYNEKWYFEFVDFLKRKDILFLLSGR